MVGRIINDQGANIIRNDEGYNYNNDDDDEQGANIIRNYEGYNYNNDDDDDQGNIHNIIDGFYGTATPPERVIPNTAAAPEGEIPNGTIVKVDPNHKVDVVRYIAGGIKCKVNGYNPRTKMYTLYNTSTSALVGYYKKDDLIVVETNDGVNVQSINEWYDPKVQGWLTEEDKKDQYNNYVNLQLGISGGSLKRSKKKSRSKRCSLKRKKTMKTKKTRKKKKRSTKRKRR